jgi:hypothetical protein
MNKLMAIWAILPVALLTGLVAFWRADQVLAWYPIPIKGIAGKVVAAILFSCAAVIFGLVATVVYGWLIGNRPDTAAQIYLWVGVGLAVALSIAAVVVSTILKRGPVVAWIVWNFLWGVGYGWILPLLLRR